MEQHDIKRELDNYLDYLIDKGVERFIDLDSDEELILNGYIMMLMAPLNHYEPISDSKRADNFPKLLARYLIEPTKEHSQDIIDELRLVTLGECKNQIQELIDKKIMDRNFYEKFEAPYHGYCYQSF